MPQFTYHSQIKSLFIFWCLYRPCSLQLMLKSLLILLLAVTATEVPRLLQPALHCYHSTLAHLALGKLLLQCVFHFSSLFLRFLLENLLSFLLRERVSQVRLIRNSSIDLWGHMLRQRCDYFALNEKKSTSKLRWMSLVNLMTVFWKRGRAFRTYKLLISLQISSKDFIWRPRPTKIAWLM
jgi:hypothetical protein